MTVPATSTTVGRITFRIRLPPRSVYSGKDIINYKTSPDTAGQKKILRRPDEAP